MKFEHVVAKIPDYGFCRVHISVDNGVIQSVEIVEPFSGDIGQAKFYVTPGFTNSHIHPNQLLDRRILDELCITELLDQMHVDYKKTDEERYYQALLVLIEATKSGATSISSVASHPRPVIRAYKQLGIKGSVACFYNDRWEGFGSAPAISLFDTIEKDFEAIMREQTDDIHIRIGTASVESASNNLLILLDKLAKQFSTKVDIHVSEGCESVNTCLESRGTTPVNLLAQLGVLSPRWDLIHGVSLTDEEVKLISKYQANFIHCPVSNAKTGVGVAPIKELLKLGVQIGLGSDACSNNNTNNILSEAYFASLIHSAFNCQASILPSDILMSWLTQGRTIASGEPADLLFWSLDDSAFVPLAYGNFDSVLLYNAPDIKPHTVMVSGRTIVENYRLATLSEENVKEQVNASGSRIHNFGDDR